MKKNVIWIGKLDLSSKTDLEKSYTITNRSQASYCLLWYWHAAFMFIAVRALCMIKRDYLKMIKIKPKRLMYFFVLNILWLNIKKILNNIRQLFRTLRKSLFLIFTNDPNVSCSKKSKRFVINDVSDLFQKFESTWK